MAKPHLLWCLFWAAIFSTAEGQNPNFLIAAPRMLHVGVEENIWVQFEWPPGSKPPAGDVKVEIILQNQINQKNCSRQEILLLNKGNDYTATKSLQLTPQMVAACELNKMQNERYVQLVASCPSVFGKYPKMLNIPVSYKRGYIFIQTDKSIYTPKQKGELINSIQQVHRIRILHMHVHLYVLDSPHVKTRSPITPSLPFITTPGINAFYSTAPESNFTAEFEVKQYVLPNFEVKIIPKVPYFLISKKDFSFRIEARYVYGEDVVGTAYVRAGIIDKDGKRTMLKGLEQQVKLDSGIAPIRINKADILSKVSQPEVTLLGFTFYIAASVVESASGILEEKELTNLKFVSSPYKLDLSMTRTYFIPGSPAQIVAVVSRVDGSSPGSVSVELSHAKGEKQKFTTDKNGETTFLINTSPNDKTLDLEVSVKENEGSVLEKISLSSFISKSNSFLYMSAEHQVLSPGQAVRVTLKVVKSDPRNVANIHYMVLNKGQILLLRSIKAGDLINIQIQVTSSMIPSFRVIAYYYLGSEIIANSLWLDVADECEGKVILEENAVFRPEESFKLKVETEDLTTVGLVAVDTAVYLLNSKNKLTPDKMFKAMNAYDLGCSAGGGRDYSHVFTDAGLAFTSSAGYSNIQDLGCKVSSRKKRSAEATQLAKDKVNSYSTNDLRKCCSDGITQVNKGMVRDCNKRANRVSALPCRNAFRECCLYAEELRKKYARKTTGLARTQGANDELDFADETDVRIRSAFPESWLWKTVNVNKLYRETVYVPDSITTWEIQAIGMSKGKGFCIAEPLKVTVFKKFHIYMRVPYSIKRFEQIELRPVLYNYLNNSIKVKVLMLKKEEICSPDLYDESSGGQLVTVPGMSAISVPFTIVPLGKTDTEISVLALGEKGISDGVKKILKMEVRRYRVTYSTKSIISVHDPLPANMIPDGSFHSTIKVAMESAMNTINSSLSIEGVSGLIRVPRGCAEQTMMLTAPGVYALRYLDHTQKWTLLPPERKREGLDLMEQGISRVMEFKKDDGSYGAWKHRGSSTWLTAFIVKVMSLGRKYIYISVDELRQSADYLSSLQMESGAFKEKMPVIHLDMQGGVTGTNAEVSLTAYVVIALHHSLEALSEKVTKIQKAIEYLQQKLGSLSEPYPLAITAYALTLTSHDSFLKDTAYTLLMLNKQGDPKKKEMYFGQKDSSLAIETTAYALMTALLRQDKSSASMLYNWLTQQQNFGGGFKSTQDTVMGLEALSEYWIHTYTEEENAIKVEIISLERQGRKQTISLRNMESAQENLVSGEKTRGRIEKRGHTVMSYNVIETEKSTCSQLGLEVTLIDVDIIGNEPDNTDYDYDYEEMADEPMDNIAWHDLRMRARREASQPKAKDPTVICKYMFYVCREKSNLYIYIFYCILYLFCVSQLKESEERYISHYESYPGRILMYYDEVPDDKDNCVTFEAIQKVKISLLQPSSAVAYDFYEPETRCTAFYGAPNKPQFINTLCTGDVCQCAESPCPKKSSILYKVEKELSAKDRKLFACYEPVVMYGKRTCREGWSAFVKLRFCLFLSTGGDESIKAGEVRLFYHSKSCKMRLGLAEYLIMGKDGVTLDNNGNMRYILESNSWVEEMPSEETCATTRLRNRCFELTSFTEDYKSKGCDL
uniref:Anaphylatoxin-like domain-containing protein n=1 Tax=Leptobrachium leishanense TaxID=445787 RepID=A0A8C5PP12_9ANUR